MREFLNEMAAGSRRRARNARRRMGEAELMRRAVLRPKPPKLRLDPSGFDIIAEIKPTSPSAGELEDAAGSIARAGRYVEGGAAAISVLTEPAAFGGSLALLREIAIAVVAPVLRKDFLVDPYQAIEARDEGASGVLLIASLLEGDALDETLAIAAELGLFALVEATDLKELDRAERAAEHTAGDVYLGVNARDLTTLRVDHRRFETLAPVSRRFPVVAESGLEKPDDAAHVASLGYRAALIGTSLMRTHDPAASIASFLEAGRGAIALKEAHR